MKSISIIIIALLIISNIGISQIPNPGTYTINNTFGAFHGTWLWVNGSDTVKIYLTTKKVRIDDYDVDLLCGWHIYKQGSTIIETSYPNINVLNSQTITLWNDNSINNPKVEGTITDLTKASKENFLFLTINAAQNQVTWRCTEWGGHGYTVEQPPPPIGITLPRNMILVKQ